MQEDLRKICVVTGSRAEYGLLYPLLKKIEACSDLQLSLIVCGAHLSQDFGYTYSEIEQDGFVADQKIDDFLPSDTATGVAKSIARGIDRFAEAFTAEKPDMVVLLGDRYEILAAGIAAMIACLPIAHIGGGQLTEGAIDDAMRHGLTKMAHLHFTANEVYRRRIVQMGERPERVFTVGSLGLDNIRNTKLLAREALESDIGFDFGEAAAMVTYHPVTLDPGLQEPPLAEMLAALDQAEDLRLLFTMPNADAEGRVVSNILNEFVARHSNRAKVVASLGRLRYLSALACVDMVIGNSSSGLIEAPSFGIPTVNVGSRQKGRLRAASVIDCAADRNEIRAAMAKAQDPEFRKSLKHARNPYGDGHSAPRICALLRTANLDRIIQKSFYDIEFPLAVDLVGKGASA